MAKKHATSRIACFGESEWGDIQLDLIEQPNEGDAVPDRECYFLLMKDEKQICRARCLNPPFTMPPSIIISDIVRLKLDNTVSGLPQCLLFPAAEYSHQSKEWRRFLGYLRGHGKVAIAKIGSYKLYISAGGEAPHFSHGIVSYQRVETEKLNGVQNQELSGEMVQRSKENMVEKHISTPDMCYTRKASAGTVGTFSDQNFVEATGDHHVRGLEDEIGSGLETNGRKYSDRLEKNYVHAHPSYLKTLSQTHSCWIFGAMAELVDNSRDAKATELKICVDSVFSKADNKEIPILSFIDDGCGMTHEDILRMISFGHKQPEADDPDRVGRFGIGFKTGAMRLGKDALVLTQTADSRSIAFLSQSLNEGKDNLEIPIVSYQRKGHVMEVDGRVQTEAFAKCNLRAIKEFSPFNEYLIGEKAALFSAEGTGTQIYIWNLDKWGSDCCLEWSTGISGGSTFHQGDILVRSKRIRSRPGQTSRTVPLDYSLQSYLEVIFLDPRMKIYVQGSLVRSRPLAKSLSKTIVEKGSIMGKPVQLILGRCQLEWEQANCGIFLYWHGRLIEAYKRVGSMIHSADAGRGVIGVIDVSDLMNEGGHVWVHSNKQAFQDCELYARLEEWLGSRFDDYWDKYFDKLQLKKGSALHKPDHEWVQCDKCRKWRMLPSGFDISELPDQWFCYMSPFKKTCKVPEQKVEPGLITVSTKRSACEPKQNQSPVERGGLLLVEEQSGKLDGRCGNNSDGRNEEEGGTSNSRNMKRLKKGAPRKLCFDD